MLHRERPLWLCQRGPIVILEGAAREATMFHRTSALILLLAGLAWAQAPEPIQVPPRVIPTDQAGDPLPQGATARMGTLRWRHGGPVQFVGFLCDGNEVVSASLDGWIRVWDVATGREI